MAQTAYPGLDTALTARIIALQSGVDAVVAAVSAYKDTGAAYIGYNFAGVKALSDESRSILAMVTAEWNPALVDGIVSLRASQRWLLRLCASPETFLPSFEQRIADLAARGGRDYLYGLLRRRLKNYLVCDGDTPQSIAQVQLGDAGRWQEITILNDLTYPFVTDDEDYAESTRATGTLRFTHDSAQEDDYIIPAGTVVETPATSTRPAVKFQTTEDITIHSGELYADGPAECIDLGPIGNVGPLDVSVIERIEAEKVTYAYTLEVEVTDVAGNPASASRAFTHEAYPRVSNPEAMAGGESSNVAKIGSWILLPIEADTARTPNIMQTDQITDVRARQYGIDWWISESGQLDRDASGDIRAVGGLDNLALVARMACLTEKGDLTFHPEYGSELYKFLGLFGNDSLPDEVLLEIRKAIMPDPRFDAVNGVSLSQDVGRIDVSVEYVSAELSDAAKLNLVVRPR